MLFFDIFDNNFRIMAAAAAFVFLSVSTWRAQPLKSGRGLWLLFGGLLLILATSAMQAYAGYFYTRAVAAKVLVFAEMLLVLGSSVLLVMASSRILMHEPLNISVVFGFISLGLLLSVYAIFIADDSGIVANIRQILPVIGMTYVFLSFVSRPRIWLRCGEVSGAIAAAGLSALMVWPMICSKPYPWYLPVWLVIFLGFSYFLMIIDDLCRRYGLVNEKLEKTGRDIEKIIKSSPFPIVISRLGDDVILMANNNAAKLFGLSMDEISRYHFKDFFVDIDNRRILTERLERDKEVHDFEILVRTAGGNTPFWLLASVNVIDYHNDVVLYAAFQDITARKRRESFLQTQADRDPLTSIYNRRYFEEKAAEKIKASHERKEPFAILMLDADNFKKINDTYGHKIGDKVLIELASVCERSLRQEDLIARYGGEEFVAFISNVNAETAVMVASRLKNAISGSVVYADNHEPVRFTVSIGVAPSGISDSASLMIKMADDAMYLAKQNGRNRVELFDNEIISRMAQESVRERDESRQVHPAFFGEEAQEISLLDGIEANHIIDN